MVSLRTILGVPLKEILFDLGESRKFCQEHMDQRKEEEEEETSLEEGDVSILNRQQKIWSTARGGREEGGELTLLSTQSLRLNFNAAVPPEPKRNSIQFSSSNLRNGKGTFYF